jgi:hypothetical protein
MLFGIVSEENHLDDRFPTPQSLIWHNQQNLQQWRDEGASVWVTLCSPQQEGTRLEFP